MRLEQHFHRFLEHFQLKKPLLALSGGPDSMALFHLLRDAGIAFEVAHVNHGWRAESGAEAARLQELVGEIPFHLKELQLEGANLEDRCRTERLTFFASLSDEVLLGHHADDQAETVLKRVFEGARLTKLKGLSLSSMWENTHLYRPLLGVEKQEILAWLDEKKIGYFDDVTNRDQRFLRSRMRTELLPALSKMFGKRVEPSLCRLGKLASELDEFVEQLVSPYPLEGVIDFRANLPKTSFEWRMIVSHIFEKQELTISSHHLEQVVEHLRKNHAHKSLRIKNKYVILHRQTLEIKKV